MLLKRSLKSSTNSSKRLNRRARISFDIVKKNIRVVIPVIVLLIVIFSLNSLLTIQKINCTLNGEICPQETQIVVNKLIGTNSLFVNQKELLTYIKAVYPINKINLSYKSLNTLNLNLQGSIQYVQADVYFVSEIPVLSMDQAPNTTDSASWWTRPSVELESFVATNQALPYNLWENGSMTSTATTGASIKYIFSEKPSSEIISSIYKMIKIISKYIDASTIYIVDRRCFLSRPEQPDIIIGVPFDEGSLVPALQSISYLATIKKDARVIDLSFKNPIIR